MTAEAGSCAMGPGRGDSGSGWSAGTGSMSNVPFVAVKGRSDGDRLTIANAPAATVAEKATTPPAIDRISRRSMPTTCITLKLANNRPTKYQPRKRFLRSASACDTNIVLQAAPDPMQKPGTSTCRRLGEAEIWAGTGRFAPVCFRRGISGSRRRGDLQDHDVPRYERFKRLPAGVHQAGGFDPSLRLLPTRM